MATNAFHEIYLHFVWHTKGNLKLLTKPIEDRVHHFIREHCRKAKGVYLHTVGGTDDHVHAVINIEPSILISDLAGKLKGYSAHQTNESQGHRSVVWQKGYGVVSFGKGNLPWVIEYVENQREHHAKGSAKDRLERIECVEDENKLDQGLKPPR